MPKNSILSLLVKRTGHPLILTSAVILWWYTGASDAALLVTLTAVILLIEVLQTLTPAKPAWRVSTSTKFRLLGLYALTIVITSLLIAGYEQLLGSPLAFFRDGMAAQIWPHKWPWPMQALLLYFAADFIYYWVHRAIHRFAVLWRVTGHGFHHAFHNLGSLNAGSNHPFELVLVALPLVLLASAFGARGEAVGAAAVLVLTNAVLAHSNLSMETPLFNYLFTTSDQHRRHHSTNFLESNTNYACNAILWDRLFGTFGRGDVLQTGIGPTQPSLVQLFALPLREPADADTVASRQNA